MADSSHRHPWELSLLSETGSSQSISSTSGEGAAVVSHADTADLLSNLQQYGAIHAHLVSSLARLAPSIALLDSHAAYLKELRAKKRRSVNTAWMLSVQTSDTRARYEATRDSKLRRWSSAIVGEKARERWKEREREEEGVYTEVLEREMREWERWRELKKLEAAAVEKNERLEAQVAEHAVLSEMLSTLYSGVFDGPTPDHPYEDRLEYAYLEAQKAVQDSEDALKCETEANEFLEQAEKALGRAITAINEAVTYSNWEKYGGGAAIDDLKRRAVRDAEMIFLRRARQSIYSAQNASITTPTLLTTSVRISYNSIWDALKISDYESNQVFRKTMQTMHEEAQRAQEELTAEVAASTERKSAASARLSAAKEAHVVRKKELWEVRRMIFESVDSVGLEPPDYESAERMSGGGGSAPRGQTRRALVMMRSRERLLTQVPPYIIAG